MQRQFAIVDMRNSCPRKQTLATGLVPVGLRLLTTRAAETRPFPPAIAASGGDGRRKGNLWVAEIDVVVKRSTAGTSPVAVKLVLIRP